MFHNDPAALARHRAKKKKKTDTREPKSPLSPKHPASPRSKHGSVFVHSFVAQVSHTPIPPKSENVEMKLEKKAPAPARKVPPVRTKAFWFKTDFVNSKRQWENISDRAQANVNKDDCQYDLLSPRERDLNMNVQGTLEALDDADPPDLEVPFWTRSTTMYDERAHWKERDPGFLNWFASLSKVTNEDFSSAAHGQPPRTAAPHRQKLEENHSLTARGVKGNAPSQIGEKDNTMMQTKGEGVKSVVPSYPIAPWSDRTELCRKRRAQLWVKELEYREKLEARILSEVNVVEDRLSCRRVRDWWKALSVTLFALRLKRRPKAPVFRAGRLQLPQDSKWVHVLRRLRPLVFFLCSINQRRAGIAVIKTFLRQLGKATRFIHIISTFFRKIRYLQRMLQHRIRKERIRAQLIMMQLIHHGGEDLVHKNLSNTLDVLGSVMGTIREGRIQTHEIYRLHMREYQKQQQMMEACTSGMLFHMAEPRCPKKPLDNFLLPVHTVKSLCESLREANAAGPSRPILKGRKATAFDSVTYTRYFQRAHLFHGFSWERGTWNVKKQVVLCPWGLGHGRNAHSVSTVPVKKKTVEWEELKISKRAQIPLREKKVT